MWQFVRKFHGGNKKWRGLEGMGRTSSGGELNMRHVKISAGDFNSSVIALRKDIILPFGPEML
jgi:N-acetyl-anhydromuramyl-L-alanine amidase AmpD